MRKNRVYRIRTIADFSNLAMLRDFFWKYGKRAHLSHKQLNDGKLAVDEAVTNVMRHAYGGAPEKGPVTMELTRLDHSFQVVFKDEGKEFDWAAVIDPDLNKYVQVRRKGGLGVWLIKKLTDQVSFRRENGINILTMTYNLEAAGAAAGATGFLGGLRKRLSISLKFTLLGSSLLTAIVVGIYLFSRSSQAGMAARSFLSRGVNAVKNIADNSAEHLLDRNDMVLLEQVNRVQANVGVLAGITVVDETGLIYADTNPARLFRRLELPAGVGKLADQELLQQRYQDENGRQFINIAAPIRLLDQRIGAVYASLDMSLLDAAEGLAESELQNFFVTLAIWALAIVGLLFITSIFVHPIKKLSRAMALVGAGERNVLDMGGAVSEFSEIGRAFDEMVNRLRQSESQLTDQTRIKKEMQLAKDIQETLLPKEIPVTEGFELAGNYRSALEMGGDYYDFFFVDKRAIGLVVGDVSGKGIGAAMIMTMVRTAMRTEARGNKRAADVLDKVNRLLADDIKKGMYITMFYVILDSAKHTINYASAGHNPMILYRSSENNTYFLNPKGFAVGLQLGNPAIFASHIKSEQILLAKGDLLFIYTDGITEAMNAEREQFGETRLVNFIMANHYLSPDRFSKAMDAEISRFTGDYPQSDDITYIVVRRKEDASVAYYHKVAHLVDLVKNSNMLHERVLAETGFTEEEYEEVMARVEAEGIEAFRPTNEEPSDTESLSHATLEQSKKMVSIVRANPSWGAKRIQTLLDSEAFGFEKLTINVINKELKKLKLDTVKRRRLFSERELSENTIYKDVDKERSGA